MPKVTIMDVAAQAGVSYATVSRYLNGNPHVSPGAAERIAAAVQATGYSPNAAARSLVTRRTGTIAFVMHGEAGAITTDPNVNTILVSANRVVGAAGMQLVSLIADSPEATARIARLARAGFADGWILNSMPMDDPLFHVFAELDVPVAVSGASYGEASPFPCVDIDNHAAAVAITRHLLDAGHRRIACIAGPSAIPCSGERVAGFREAMDELFDESLVIEAQGWGQANGQEAMRELWDRLDTSGKHVRPDRYSSIETDSDVGNGITDEHPTTLSNVRQGYSGIETDNSAGIQQYSGIETDGGVGPDQYSGIEMGHDMGHDGSATHSDVLATRHGSCAAPLPIDAVVCGNDCLAIGAMAEIKARGLAVPDDIAITGFDDIPDAASATPPLTTIHQPIERFGVELAEMVLAQIEGRRPEPLVMVETGLVVRQSA